MDVVLLRLRPALVPLPARLRLRRRGALADRRRADALPLRRAADHQPRARGPRRRPPGTCRCCSASSSSLKAVAYWLDRYGLAVKSSDFKATDNWTGLRYVDANAYLPAKTILFCIAVDLRAAVLRHPVAAHLAAARDRLRPDGAVGDPDRRAVPGDRAEVPGPAERAGQGSAVHPEEHRGDARGVRHRRRPGHGLPGQEPRPRTGQAARRRRHHGEHPAARPERGLADVPAAAADARATTSSRPPGRRPLQGRTARSRTPSSVCAS